jgi:hypothetical protein
MPLFQVTGLEDQLNVKRRDRAARAAGAGHDDHRTDEAHSAASLIVALRENRLSYAPLP